MEWEFNFTELILPSFAVSFHKFVHVFSLNVLKSAVLKLKACVVTANPLVYHSTQASVTESLLS